MRPGVRAPRPGRPARGSCAGAAAHAAAAARGDDRADRLGPGLRFLPQAPLAAARPGGAVALDVTLPPGSYEVYCGVCDHAQRGMLLPLTVTPPAG